MIRLTSSLTIVNVKQSVTKVVLTPRQGGEEMLMKMLFAMVAIACFSLTASAKDSKEMYVQLEPQVQLIISNEDCKKWKTGPGVQLNYAYAVNLATGEQVTGCWTHVKDVIQIELTDDLNNFYSYKVNADHFLLRPGL